MSSGLPVDTRLKSPLLPERAAAFYASVRNEVARFHGLTSSTMMRGEAYGFYQLGTFVERADMTARILDVKYHILLPDAAMVGSPLDYYQWAALLKSLSGFEAYRRKYHTGMRPVDVAQHAIFEREFPALAAIRGRPHPAGAGDDRRAGRGQPSRGDAVGRLLAHLAASFGRNECLREGFHEFLQGFLATYSRTQHRTCRWTISRRTSGQSRALRNRARDLPDLSCPGPGTSMRAAPDATAGCHAARARCSTSTPIPPPNCSPMSIVLAIGCTISA